MGDLKQASPTRSRINKAMCIYVKRLCNRFKSDIPLSSYGDTTDKGPLEKLVKSVGRHIVLRPRNHLCYVIIKDFGKGN